jgi:hypothetical protein
VYGQAPLLGETIHMSVGFPDGGIRHFITGGPC